MSDPTKQKSIPISALGRRLSKAALQFSYLPEGALCNSRLLRQPQYAFGKLSSRDLEIRTSVRLPGGLTADEHQQARLAEGHEVLLASDVGGWDVRKRVAEHADMAASFFDGIDWNAPLPFNGVDVTERAVGVVAAGGGAHLSMGRLEKFYPAKGSIVSHPPTRTEVKDALYSCGHPIHGGLKRKEVVSVVEGDDIKVNPNAENGFPVGRTFNDPAAREKCVELAAAVRERLEGAADVVAAFRELEILRPELTLFKGKAKYDVYKIPKLAEAQLRFYNVVPRHLGLLMQQATQPYEEACETLETRSVRTTQGVGLSKGRAEVILRALDFEVYGEGAPLRWLHCGDDTIFTYSRGDGGVGWFTLDCTAFDLTQHADATAAIHEELFKHLREIDEVSAGVWYACARERSVTVSGSVVARMRHGGPSGMPLQSKVNDVLMEVVCTRIRDALYSEDGDWRGREIAAVVREVAAGLSLQIRLESHRYLEMEGVKPRTVRELVRLHPFLFIGYYFWVDACGRCQVTADIPRALAQMPYPTARTWLERGMQLKLQTALKAAGVALSMGVPMPGLEDAFDNLLTKARACVDRALADIPDAAMGPELSRYAYAGLEGLDLGLRGVRNVLNTDALRKIWCERWDDGSVESVKVLITGKLRIAKKATQVVARATARTAGRPPPQPVSATLAQLRARISSGKTTAETRSKLISKLREQLLEEDEESVAWSDDDDTEWVRDEDEERSEAGSDWE